ncbi:venom factor-like isoform X2 [Pyxicephalus adspersus]|uniref:venom factor-like isoform X2 n=1 Tax=Pyxicephalus adspersus TaxID=30357 RepID=UPI003B5B2A4B
MGYRAFCVILLGCLAGLSYGQTLCTLITPSVLRIDSEETIVIDGHNSAFDVEYLIQTFPVKNFLARGKISINSGNQYLGTAKIIIPGKDLIKDQSKKQYVSLEVKSTNASCNMEKTLLLNFHSGYIFIQTDKPIYTPGTTVQYRLYPVNFNMQPTNRTVLVEFLNPDGILVKNEQFIPDASGIISKTYPLSDVPSIGTWTISTKFEGTLQEFTTNFEVKEYVLPIFEVKIKPDRNFMYFDDETFFVTIKADYTYGKKVSGNAFVLFSLKKDNERKTLTESLRRIEIDDGTGRAALLKADVLKAVNKPEDLLDCRLHVSTTVITDTGSDWVDAELDNVYIVKSAYKILLTRTSKYFKPGMPFNLMVLVKNPDGSPANGIPVVVIPGESKGITQEDGTAILVVNTASDRKPLQIKVRTAIEGLQDTRQANGETTITAYQPHNGQGNYLHITVGSNVAQPGKQIVINFIILTGNATDQNQIKQFTFLILSKGRIINVDRQKREQGQSLVTKTLIITPDLIPSFRIVAYYIIGKEIVSDSLWVDVVDECMGTLVVDSDKKVTEPTKPITLTLKADPGSHVGLVAVDKGVFVLNSKNRITQSKVWDVVEKSDIGCTPGSGANNMDVFFDAGLAVQTNFGMDTRQRSESSCGESKSRSSATLIEMKTKKALKFNEKLERQCCHDGMGSNPMGHSCERRAKHIQLGEKCMEVFLDCCKFIELKNKIEKELEDGLERSDHEALYMNEGDIEVRSEFPESWLWNVIKITQAPDANGVSTQTLTNKLLKDSITTWEVLAVSLSQNKGICVAKPLEIQAFKSFFIDLRLPYSVVRNEQVGIRAVIYNNENVPLKVRVTLTYNPQFCSLSTPSRKYSQEITVKKLSSHSVPFVIVPLTVGMHDVEVMASVFGRLMSDGVRKKLKVVPEGVRKVVTLLSEVLEPERRGRSGEQLVNVPSLRNKRITPNSEVSLLINLQGSPIADFVEKSIDGSNLNYMIIVPTGCAEQNMLKLAPLVIATHFLDKTNQWDRVGLHRRAEAISNMESGYATQLTHRAKDGSGSYTALPGSTRGTWLTAYIVKIFAMAKEMIHIEDSVLCSSVKWLVKSMQKPDGMFQEHFSIGAQYSRGGLAGSADPDVAITAFVTIALLESQRFCTNHVNNLQLSIDKAMRYISDHYGKLTRPHSIAITAYALARAGKLHDSTKLMSAATGKSSWDDSNSKLWYSQAHGRFISLEATSYALLTLLQLEEYELADSVARWLIKSHVDGERYGSTQTIVMLFQSLAKYQEVRANRMELDMDVSFQLPERNDITRYHLNVRNSLNALSDETKINKDFVVKAVGKGQASLTVTAVYYEIVTEKENECNHFDFTITARDEPHVKRPDNALGTISIEICFRYRGDSDLTMSIVDVTMMTGYSPDIDDLKRLKNGVDRYISQFEFNKGANDKGTLIIYLDKISHSEEECMKFNAHRYFDVSLVQAGSVTIYDYYTPETRCTKFYHTVERDHLLGHICQGGVCRCSEGNCLMAQQGDAGVTAKERKDKACEAGMDYVYKATLTEIQYANDYDRYVMDIKSVLKSGTDENVLNQKRTFISHIKCRETLNFKKGLDYILYGTFNDVWKTEANKYSYIIGSNSWVEWWPNKRECQSPEYEELCDSFETIAEELSLFGCEK